MARAQEAGDGAGAVRQVEDGPAFDWRFIRGEGVEGAFELLKPEEAPITRSRFLDFLNSSPAPAARGRLLLKVEGRGIFIGLFTVREDGRSIVGAFWPDGATADDPIAGTIDVGAAPDGELEPDEGRVLFLDGGEYGDLRAD
ncbi:MAG: hypothetical protein AAFW46_16285 [Pseudomonadota bacterium]